MNVSSVKNLNGEVFSAVQDAYLTNIVQTNSAQWAEGGSTFDPTYMSAQIDNKLNKSEIGFRKVNSIDYVSGISGKNISAKFAYRANTAYNADHATTASYDDNGNSLTTTYYNAQEANNKANDLFNFVQSNSANWGGGSSPAVDNNVIFNYNYNYDPSNGSQNNESLVSGATELYFEAAVDSQQGNPSEIVFYRNGNEIGRAYWSQVSSDGTYNYLTASYNNADGGIIQIQNYNGTNYNLCYVSANGVKTLSFNQGSYECAIDKEVKFNIVGFNFVGQINGWLQGASTQLTSFTGGLTDFTAKGYDKYDTYINYEDSNNSYNYNLSAEFGGNGGSNVPGYNETVLWSGTGASSFNVSENLSSFETVKMYGYPAEQGSAYKHVFEFPGTNPFFDININDFNDTSNAIVKYYTRYSINGLAMEVTTALHMWATTGSINSWSGPGSNPILIDKVVGINRKV